MYVMKEMKKGNERNKRLIEGGTEMNDERGKYWNTREEREDIIKDRRKRMAIHAERKMKDRGKLITKRRTKEKSEKGNK